MADFKLDTIAFADAAKSAKSLAKQLESIGTICNSCTDLMFLSWSGKARNEFQVQYSYYERQLTDLTDNLWTLYEDIVTAETSYIEQDIQNAKQADGINSDYK